MNAFYELFYFTNREFYLTHEIMISQMNREKNNYSNYTHKKIGERIRSDLIVDTLGWLLIILITALPTFLTRNLKENFGRAVLTMFRLNYKHYQCINFYQLYNHNHLSIQQTLN